MTPQLIDPPAPSKAGNWVFSKGGWNWLRKYQREN
jgi:hypothetical protein